MPQPWESPCKQLGEFPAAGLEVFWELDHSRRRSEQKLKRQSLVAIFPRLLGPAAKNPAANGCFYVSNVQVQRTIELSFAINAGKMSSSTRYGLREFSTSHIRLQTAPRTKRLFFGSAVCSDMVPLLKKSVVIHQLYIPQTSLQPADKLASCGLSFCINRATRSEVATKPHPPTCTMHLPALALSIFFTGLSAAQTITGQFDCLPAGGFTLCQNLWGKSM
jgi:hypothetical protein